MIKNKLSVLSFVLVFILILSAGLATPAYADEAPPVEPQVEETNPPANTEEEASPLTSGESFGQTQGESDSAPLEESTSDVEQTILEQLPENTEIIVLDEEGEPLPLATEEAQEAIAFIDPMWCPVGVKPKANTGGCTASYANLFALINDIATGVIAEPTKAGVIWIQTGADSSAANIVIDGLDPDLGSWSTFALTLQGGWIGTDLSTTIVGPSTFTKTISIINWNAPVTINDISIVNSASYGLHVITTGNVTLKNVTAENNGNYGSRIENDSGTGNVTITNSKFNNQTNTGGLYIATKGAIVITSITANNNNGIGAYIQNQNADTPKPVTLAGTNTFNNNNSSGLSIDSKGAITLNNIYANSNTVYGAYIDNDAANPAVQNVTFTGTNEFKYNGSTGLIVSSRGAVLLNNVTANTNNFGVSILNNLGTAAAPVTIKGTNSFNDNVGTGLNIQSYGIVTLNNITANGNGTGMAFGYGVSIANSGLTNFKGVTITGTNSFNDNYNTGLQISSSGAVTLNNITASNNTTFAYGVSISNTASGNTKPMAVTINGSNTFYSNYYTGLEIGTYGSVTLNNVKANNNGQGANDGYGHGVYIFNIGANKLQNVTIKGINEFIDNFDNGLYVYTDGNILTNSITANLNNDNGVLLINNVSGSSFVTMTGTNFFNANNLENLYISSKGIITLNNITANSSVSSDGAYISNASADTAKNVTINGTNTFNSNDDFGLNVISKGVITVNNLNVTGNGFGSSSSGVYLYNINSPTNAGVNVNGTNTFNSNDSSGLVIWTLGNVKTNSINANANTGAGLYIYGAFSPNNGNVTMTGTNSFSANTGGGLQIDVYGTVTLSNISATGSTGGNGVYINNAFGGSAVQKNVTLTGTNVMSNNSGGSGLIISTFGAVVTNNLTINDNGNVGLFVQNNGGTKPMNVTLNGTNKFDGNGSDNVNISSDGLIKINNLTSTDSGNMGAALSNSTGTAGVTLTGTNYFDSNTNAGLFISSAGVITLSNITSTNSSDMGAQITNTLSGFATPKNVTLTGTNNFSGNALTGLEIRTYGSVTINNLTANNNGSAMNLTYGEGVDILNYQGNNTIVANVTLTGNNTFNGNYTQGLKITSFGAIKANNVTASTTTTSYGAWLDTSNAPTNAYGVTLSGTNKFEDNGNDGLHIDSKGTVLLNNLTITLNGSNGMYVNNTYAGANTPKPVTITGTNNFSNNVAGFYINSYGAVTLSKVTSSNNTSGPGGVIDNSATNVPSNVTVTGYGVFNNNNTGNGLLVISKGAVTLTNITTIGNSFSGLDVNNNAGTGNVTITGTNIFTDNGDNGATINSIGNVSITKVTGDENGQSGLYVTTTGTVIITCGSFNMNNWYGWEVDNATLVTLKGVFTASNLLGDYDTTSPLNISRACPLP